LTILFFVIAAANGKVILSKTYVLRNILPEEQNDPQIIHHTDEEYQSTGLLYIILSLIFVNEQSMNDGQYIDFFDYQKEANRE
jgi:MAGE family